MSKIILAFLSEFSLKNLRKTSVIAGVLESYQNVVIHVIKWKAEILLPHRSRSKWKSFDLTPTNSFECSSVFWVSYSILIMSICLVISIGPMAFSHSFRWCHTMFLMFMIPFLFSFILFREDNYLRLIIICKQQSA